jgi:hypothetical protein
MKCTGRREDVVQFVKELLANSKLDWRSITITRPAPYADYSASIVTDTSSADTLKKLARNFYSMLTIT